jgi:hypothetical protein
VQNPADAVLLNTPISSPAVIARFPYLANPNNVYPGFPANQPLNQALRPYPQWGGVPPFLGPPLGDTWFDSLQVKLTQRFSHGLSMQAAFAWEKELTNGANSNTSYLTPDPPLINDVFNTSLDKQISAFSLPEVLVISFNYTTPKIEFSGAGKRMRALSWLLRDWTYSGVLRYQSGQLIETPPSANNLLATLARGPSNNPALWGGGNTFLDRVPGQPLFIQGIDPNCHCFDPTKQLVLNPNAWVEPPFGTFGTSAPCYNDYRWQRQPAESMAFGRVFRMREGMSLMVRAEFQNIFNRVFYSAPSVGGIFATTTSTPTAYNNTFANGQPGALSAGYGFVNTFNGAGAQPRSGQIVARFTF